MNPLQKKIAPTAGPPHHPAVPSHPPRREEIEGGTLEVLRRGRRGKADLLVVDAGEGPLVVKDFSRKAWPRRLLGRMLTWYECRAYRRLGPLDGVPALIGRVDAHALALERVDGVQLTEAPDRFDRGEDHLAQIRRLMDRLLDRGFAHLDIRNRRNVLLRRDGRVVAIDLGGALWYRPGGLAERWLRPWVAWFYRDVELKWKALLTPGRLTGEDLARLRRFQRSRRLWIFKKMRLKEEGPESSRLAAGEVGARPVAGGDSAGPSPDPPP